MQIRNCLMILFTLSSGALFAQRADFSGTWLLKDQQSISGKMYSNGVPKQIKVTETAGNITIEKTTAGANGDVTSTDIITDGKPFETVTASKRKKIITIVWNGAGFTEVTNIYSATETDKKEFTYTDIWSIDDGKFTLQRKAENFVNGEVWESKAIYEK